MKQVLKFILALLFMVLAISLALTVYFVKFNNQSLFGSTIKNEVIKRPKLVNAFGIDEPGDYRYFYADDNSSSLDVIFASSRDVSISDSATEWVNNMIQQTLGKNVSISMSNNQIISKSLYTDDDLNSIRGSLKNEKKSTLYIVYLSRYSDHPGLAGITLHKDTIFIFKQSLEELNQNPELQDRLEQSTIMHEWAHLLGVEHTENEDCIMTEKIHVNDDPNSWKGFIPIEYCSSTIYQIDQLSRSRGV